MIENDQYDTTVNNQLAAGLDYDFVYITPLSTKTRIGLVEQGKLQPLNQQFQHRLSRRDQKSGKHLTNSSRRDSLCWN